MTDPRTPDRNNTDPAYEDRLHKRPPLSDPAADPLYVDPTLADRPINTRGRGGLIAAGIIAILLVIAVIAFSSGTMTDPETTAVIPDQTEVTPQPAQPSDAVPQNPSQQEPSAPNEAAPAPIAPSTPTPQ